MLVLAPVMCILSGIGISSILTTYMRNLDATQVKKSPTSTASASSARARRTDDSSSYPKKNEVAFGVVCMMTFFLMTYVFHCTWVTSEAYSSPSIVLSARSGDGSKYIFDDFREAYWWLRYNTHEVRRAGLGISHCLDMSMFLGCESDVLVGLWVSNNSDGKSDNSGGQQHMEQYAHQSSWTGTRASFMIVEIGRRQTAV
jgi:hypothetical protein